MTRFGREIRLEVITPEGTINVQNLRMAFNIKKTTNWGTNSCVVNIWNLNPSTRSPLRNFGDRLILYAGYAGEAGTQLLFRGQTTQLTHRFDQPEIISSIECADGERNLNTIQLSLSYAENTSAKEVIRDIAAKADLTITNFADVIDQSFEKGWSYAGNVSEALSIACGVLKVFPSVQNENLIILPVNGVSNTLPHQINLNTGMIGVPQQFTYKAQYLPGAARLVGWKVRTLLRPEIIPGDEVRIQSDKVNYNLDGAYKVIAITHNGDTHGNSWDSLIEVIPKVTI